MKKLCEVAQLIRSKNAGPFMITIDVIFPDRGIYDKVLSTGALEQRKGGQHYAVRQRRR